MNFSHGEASREGRWAAGESIDGRGTFEYVAQPEPLTDDEGALGVMDTKLHGTPPRPVSPEAAV